MKASSIKRKQGTALFLCERRNGDGETQKKTNKVREKDGIRGNRSNHFRHSTSTSTTRASMSRMHISRNIKERRGNMEKLFEIEDQVKELKLLGANVEKLEKLIEEYKSQIKIGE